VGRGARKFQRLAVEDVVNICDICKGWPGGLHAGDNAAVWAVAQRKPRGVRAIGLTLVVVRGYCRVLGGRGWVERSRLVCATGKVTVGGFVRQGLAPAGGARDGLERVECLKVLDKGGEGDITARTASSLAAAMTALVMLVHSSGRVMLIVVLIIIVVLLVVVVIVVVLVVVVVIILIIDINFMINDGVVGIVDIGVFVVRAGASARASALVGIRALGVVSVGRPVGTRAGAACREQGYGAVGADAVTTRDRHHGCMLVSVVPLEADGTLAARHGGDTKLRVWLCLRVRVRARGYARCGAGLCAR
jgi:hypothetical protein